MTEITQLRPGVDGARVLLECGRRGIELYVEDGRVRWRAPTGAMDIALLKRIKTSQPVIVTILTFGTTTGRWPLVEPSTGVEPHAS